MANNQKPRPRVGLIRSATCALAIFVSSANIGAAFAQPAATGDFRGEIGTFDTQAALHLSADDVVTLQKSLIRLSFLSGAADGAFDDRTQAALAAWQKAHGLLPTGRLAMLQWGALQASDEGRAPAWREEIGAVDTEAALALRASDVATIQTTLLRLRIFREAPTGAFDENTRRALAYWQKVTGYAPTGHIGPKQWAGLREAAPLAPKLDDLQRELGTVYGEAALELTPGEIKVVQDRLCAVKDLRGPISGDLDEATRSALIQWQKDELITATGYLGPMQFDALLASTPRGPDGVSAAPCGEAEMATPSVTQTPAPKATQKARMQTARLRYRHAHPSQPNPLALFMHGFGMGLGQVFAQRNW
jgi:peptidoglycan hydrolase-like protein with peptidoglycan-binding domain